MNRRGDPHAYESCCILGRKTGVARGLRLADRSTFAASQRKANGGLARWRTQKAFLAATDVETVSRGLKQNRRDFGSRAPIVEIGWPCIWYVQGENTTGYMQVTCGGWALGNQILISLPRPMLSELRTMRPVISAIVKGFEPDWAVASTSSGYGRNAALKLPFPVVDWMVYFTGVRIPPEEVPGVLTVEPEGDGTLVITSECPPDVKTPEGLALIERVEPIIRRYQPPPMKEPNVKAPESLN